MMESPEENSAYKPMNEQKIKFNLSVNELSCFISERPKIRSAHKRTLNKCKSPKLQIKLLNEMSSSLSCDTPYLGLGFNHSVVFPQYPTHEIYSDQESLNDQTSHENVDDQAAEEIVSQCLRAITDDTNDRSICSSQSLRFGTKTVLNSPKKQYIQRQKKQSEQSQFSIDLNETKIDGRTTLMLRNIPNKYTQQMILDEVSSTGLHDKYDFFYLPIDYKNQCNVGYAFINLIDVAYVSAFYQKFHHKKWPKFNSEKICQVCYARIQGTSQLLNHFRQSSSMHREQRLRPIIYLRGKQSIKSARDNKSINLDS